MVTPATKAAPCPSTASDRSPSQLPPPRNVEYTRLEPGGDSLVTKPSPKPLFVVSKAPGVVGKATLHVSPATVTAPCASRSSDVTQSSSAPPTYVDHMSPGSTTSAQPGRRPAMAKAKWLPRS